jgi:hypothetical protein
MFNGYVMLVRFPKGHVMERHPGPVMIIPEQHWENFMEAMRPSLDKIGIVTNKPGFMDGLRLHYPEVAEKIDSWGHGVMIQIWAEPVTAYSPIPRQQMQNAS